MSRARVPASKARAHSLAVHLGVLGLAVLSAGCASKQAAYQPPARVAGPPGQQVAGPGWRVEIEDDGLPSQLAPRQRRPEPDDPREPWSPNYGGPPTPPRRQADMPAAAPVRVSTVDEDEIIRRAIAEHEMRRPD